MSDQYVGEIRMFAGNFAPVDWEFCNGQLLAISGNEALFSLLGTTYGGDGTTNFGLPDLRGRLPIGQGTSSFGSIYQRGQMGGTEEVTLQSGQLPAHSHTLNVSGASTQAGPGQAFWGPGEANLYSNTAPDGKMSTAALGAAGGNQAHDNMMPYLPLSFIIATVGNYPTTD